MMTVVIFFQPDSELPGSGFFVSMLVGELSRIPL